MDIENQVYIENPMNIEVIPVAKVVGLEVMGEVLVEQKRETINSFCSKLNYFASISIAMFFLISLLAGLIIFMIWFSSPKSLGTPDD